jgi:hypothetical protein
MLIGNNSNMQSILGGAGGTSRQAMAESESQNQGGGMKR